MTENKLTPQQEKFARLVADGKTQADAYRGSYNVKPSTKDDSVHKLASRLMQKVDIRCRVDELRKELADKELWTREDSLRTLIDKALPLCEKPQDFVAVLKELNAMQGFNAPIKTDNIQKIQSIAIIPATEDPEEWLKNNG
jgi:hypothetical protein